MSTNKKPKYYYCSGGFSNATTDMCWFGVWWGHDTDERTGCVRLGSGVGWTSIGTLSEVWVGGRRDTVSVSDWGDHLRTTGPVC
jgi:hypothetical protein